MSRLIFTPVLVVLLLVGAAPARAANFTVNPMQISLSPSIRSAVVTIRNTSADELRFQVSAYQWDQDERGGIKLADTSSLIIFPQLLTLAPGAQRQVRIGTDATASGNELTFRIFFEELPSARTVAGNGVQMRTRIGLPVFVRPAGTLAAGIQIHDLRAVDGKIGMSVQNAGKGHGVVDTIRIVGADAAGKTVFTHEEPGWYVLANRSTNYQIPVTGAGCSAASFTATVVTAGKKISDRVAGPIPGCQ